MLKIGVSPCFMYPDVDRIVFGRKSLAYVEQDMARYLSRPGVWPILIPDLPEAELTGIVEELDGLVLQGGTDLAPETYGESPIGRWKGDPIRDRVELAILSKAMERAIPVFGICRGFQLMNAYFGGTLYQDLDTQDATSIKHRDADAYDQVNHEIEIVAGTWFADLNQGEALRRVNSVHHQAVKTLGEDLEVWATSAEDGLIEAFGWKGAPAGKVMGVQWHPEFFHNSQVPLMDAERLYSAWLDHVSQDSKISSSSK
ncbi:gamma-glutamyl-gamma-aminobutyrate hydrolase family protein [Pontibacter sp. G13]|uniref:gamma-glutamyl-gamma-aminobutyrate hydrolase family protein n=1 Tax=Pontibacter sp. G13 TaxID=3074898 RepID=UPI00288B3C4B|nr:gamma-glutamyl-gamma-aminobutyrate hydrolase family protein [Pontibacter sp. G13]WNJ16826.1 gamma-glutamyl-gamma-aminobutyrate hydrolase family protein [Pontibacter sp. G13]